MTSCVFEVDGKPCGQEDYRVCHKRGTPTYKHPFTPPAETPQLFKDCGHHTWENQVCRTCGWNGFRFMREAQPVSAKPEPRIVREWAEYITSQLVATPDWRKWVDWTERQIGHILAAQPLS